MVGWTEHNQGIYFVPALSASARRGGILKRAAWYAVLTDAATPDVLARVALESITFQIADVFFAME